MSKTKYIFNPDTLQYDKVKQSKSKTLLKGVSFFILTGIVGFFAFTFISPYVPELNLKERELTRELDQMKVKFNLLNDRLDLLGSVLDNIHDRGANIHEVVFGSKPMDDNIWNGGVGGHEQYNDLINFNSKNILVKSLKKADDLSRKLSLQSMELDRLEKLAVERENILNSTPSIKPVQETHLKRDIKYLSGFGARIHPIHKISRLHKGIDFSAPEGTKIQATGDGIVSRVQNLSTGYGNNVMIDHGYDYETLYAHMDKILVKEGQKVKKGEVIGLIGDTGLSTGAHLHYEVHYQGEPVNPIQYVMDGLTPEEYDVLVKKASEVNKSLD